MRKWCNKNTEHCWKKWLAVTLSAMMLVGTVPAYVFGAEAESDDPYVVSEAMEESIDSDGLEGVSTAGTFCETTGPVDSTGIADLSGKTDAADTADTTDVTEEAETTTAAEKADVAAESEGSEEADTTDVTEEAEVTTAADIAEESEEADTINEADFPEADEVFSEDASDSVSESFSDSMSDSTSESLTAGESENIIASDDPGENVSTEPSSAVENDVQEDDFVYKIVPTIVLSETSFVYNGKTQTPQVTVKDGDTVLSENSYTLTYDKTPVNAGTYHVNVTLKGIYAGSSSAEFKITAKKITPAVTLSSTSYAYSGKARKPSVTVKDGSKKIAASNYTVTRQGGCKNIGTYKVKVKLKGNYSGAKTVTFRIVPKGTSITSVKSGNNQMTVTWKKQAVQTTGYQVQYSALSNFSKAITVTIKNNTSVSRVIKNLTCENLYHVRVRTYKKTASANYYSSWSAKKSVTITKGTSEMLSMTPVITVTGKNFVNTISWKKISGITAYEVYYRKGAKGKWVFLKETPALKVTHKVTHGVSYRYIVRAYIVRVDGSRVFGEYSKVKQILQYHTPQFQTKISNPTSTKATTLCFSVKNTGKATMVVYAENAQLQDGDDSKYNRDLQMTNSKGKILSSVKIDPGKAKILTFKVKGSSTRYNLKSLIYFEFRYDTLKYFATIGYDNETIYGSE